MCSFWSNVFWMRNFKCFCLYQSFQSPLNLHSGLKEFLIRKYIFFRILGLSNWHLYFRVWSLSSTHLNVKDSLITVYLSFLASLVCLNWHLYFITFQGGNLVSQAPLNSTYWAPLDAHDPIKVQQIMLGLTKTSAEKMDLALARDTKICK